MKISGYHKSIGDSTELKLDYDNLDQYDHVYISKVFTDTIVPLDVLNLPNVTYGGTGFYFDEAPQLDCEIEHSFPDYHLYDDFVKANSQNRQGDEFKFYTDYSIGFLTRGCFRKCKFCVNQKYNKVSQASPLAEFLDMDRPKICMLDDNFFGYAGWREALQELIDTGKPFRFHQGLDERILTDEKCEMLFSGRYDGDITFAFDKIEDYQIIEKKLELINKYRSKKRIRFYVLTAFDESGAYDREFWRRDIENTFRRIELLGKYHTLPYIMRFKEYQSSPHRGMYITLARWCNQPNYFKKESLREYVYNTDSKCAKTTEYASKRYIEQFAKDFPDLAEKYFDKHFWQ